MTRSKYFFYPKREDAAAPKREGGRILPTEQSEEIAPPSFVFRAGSTALPRHLEESAKRMATAILSDLSAMQSRMSSKKLAFPFASILSLLADFCEDFPTVTVEKFENHDICVATCTHNLLFAIGTVVHHAVTNALVLTLQGCEDENGPMVTVFAEQSSLTAEEAAEHFGLSPYRLSILKRIAAASDFSIELIPADRSMLCFRIPSYTPDTYRVFASGDPTLRAAFMQPTTYFVF